METPTSLMSIGDWAGVFLASYFSIAWAFSAKTNCYAWVDWTWSSSIGLLALGYAFGGSDGSVPLLFLAALMFAWSLRLSTLLWRRIRHHGEDPRYNNLKRALVKNIGKAMPLGFLLVFWLQAALVGLLGLPLYIQAWSSNQELQLPHLFGITLFIIGLVGESLSDQQLSQFKRQTPKGVCNKGLWKYSRHPNYFFEVVIWASYGVFHLGSEQAWLAWIPALVMLVLVNWVTGVPYAEAQSIRSRGDLYRRYQRQTSRLIPWSPKKEVTAL